MSTNVSPDRMLVALGLVFGLALTKPVLAQQGVGSGGIMVVGNCYGTGDQIDLLDFYESRIEYGFTIDLNDPNAASQDVAGMVDFAFKRLERLDPERSRLYRSWGRSFEAESANLPPGVVLQPTDDYGNVVRRPDCEIKQAVVQKAPTVAGGKRYFFDPVFMGRLTNEQKAGLRIHEIIYRDGIARGHKTSRLVRYLTALVCSRELESLSASDYEKALLDTAMDEYRMLDTWSKNLRYFPGQQNLSFEEAQASCGRLPGSTRLPILNQDEPFMFYSRFRASAIGQFIAGESGSGAASVFFETPTGGMREITLGVHFDDNTVGAVKGLLCVEDLPN